MYALPVPTRDGLHDYDTVVNRRNHATKALLVQNRPHIATAYGRYIANSGNGASLQPTPLSAETSEALKTNYDFLGSKRSHAHIRDELLGSARHNACPYCNAATVDTLDHVLPKSVYPEFSVLAQNLVPACSTCNRKKAEACFYSSRRNLMHPYFAKIPADAILFAEITINALEVTWCFYLEQSESIEDADFERIAHLFKQLDLADRYYQASVGDIIDVISAFDENYLEGEPAAVKSFLRALATSSRKSRGANYWKTAIFQALADDETFCHGGYRRLIGK